MTRCLLPRELGVEDAVAEIDGMTPVMLASLGEKGIKTLDDLADLAGDELIELLPAGTIDEAEANRIIMAARAHWFEGEDAPEADAAPAGDSEA